MRMLATAFGKWFDASEGGKDDAIAFRRAGLMMRLRVQSNAFATWRAFASDSLQQAFVGSLAVVDRAHGPLMVDPIL